MTERKNSSQLPNRRETMRNTRVPARLCALLSVGLLGACDLVVEPANNVPPTVATDNIAGVKSILTSVYARLQGVDLYGNKLMLLPDLMADNARTSQPAVNRTAEYSNAIGAHMGNWGESYTAINETNYAIASARALVEKEPALANRYLGEALFLRALLYFDLARVFSYEPGKYVNGFDTGVVLRVEPTRTAAEAVPKERAKVEEVYAQMEKDLQEAITILAQHGQTGPYAANRAAAEALLAKGLPVLVEVEQRDHAGQRGVVAHEHAPGRAERSGGHVR